MVRQMCGWVSGEGFGGGTSAGDKPIRERLWYANHSVMPPPDWFISGTLGTGKLKFGQLGNIRTSAVARYLPLCFPAIILWCSFPESGIIWLISATYF